ncbi:putative ABC transporter substrate-binding lipoprotein YhfQ precursor [compost metagenome]
MFLKKKNSRQLSTLLLLFVCILVLSACGTGGSQQAASSKPSVQPSASPTTATPTPSTEPVKKTFTHALGKTEVPEKVERVVALTPHFADHLASLGIIPVGSVVREGGDFEPYIASLLKGTESIGQSSAPNLEKVLQLKPQLILGEEKSHSKPYEALSKIAPTLIYSEKDMEQDWAKIFLEVAAATGKEQLGKDKLKEFETKTKTLKEKLGAKLGEQTVVFFKVTDKDTRVLGRKSPLGKIAYDQLGLKYPAGLPDEEGEIKIAIEKLPELNPDHIFLLDVNVPDYVNKMNETMKTPLWTSLKAVQGGHVYMKPIRATKTGFGLVMHNLFVDEIKKELLDK